MNNTKRDELSKLTKAEKHATVCWLRCMRVDSPNTDKYHREVIRLQREINFLLRSN